MVLRALSLSLAGAVIWHSAVWGKNVFSFDWDRGLNSEYYIMYSCIFLVMVPDWVSMPNRRIGHRLELCFVLRLLYLNAIVRFVSSTQSHSNTNAPCARYLHGFHLWQFRSNNFYDSITTTTCLSPCWTQLVLTTPVLIWVVMGTGPLSSFWYVS